METIQKFFTNLWRPFKMQEENLAMRTIMGRHNIYHSFLLGHFLYICIHDVFPVFTLASFKK